MTFNELNPLKNRIDDESIAKFLSDHDYNYIDRQRQKGGPEYLIIDNFADYFKLDQSDLVAAKTDAQAISVEACKEFSSARCDVALWLKTLGAPGDSHLPSANRIGATMADFRLKLNEKSQGKFGDKSLRVDT